MTERSEFEEKFPVPPGVEWCVDKYSASFSGENHSAALARAHTEKLQVWLAACAQKAVSGQVVAWEAQGPSGKRLFHDGTSAEKSSSIYGGDARALVYGDAHPRASVPEEIVSEMDTLVDLLRDAAMAEDKVDTCYDEPNKNPRLATALNWLADWISNAKAQPSGDDSMPCPEIVLNTLEGLLESFDNEVLVDGSDDDGDPIQTEWLEDQFKTVRRFLADRPEQSGG